MSGQDPLYLLRWVECLSTCAGIGKCSAPSNSKPFPALCWPSHRSPHSKCWVLLGKRIKLKFKRMKGVHGQQWNGQRGMTKQLQRPLITSWTTSLRYTPFRTILTSMIIINRNTDSNQLTSKFRFSFLVFILASFSLEFVLSLLFELLNLFCSCWHH